MKKVVTVKKAPAHVCMCKKPATAYILQNVRHCKLCGSEITVRFHMTQDEENPNVLTSKPITEDTPNLPVEFRYTVWSTCRHCRDYLRELDQNTLIDMIMKQHTRREVWK